MQTILDTIVDWSSVNDMNLNPSKTKQLILSNKRCKPSLTELNIKSTPIGANSDVKLLGVYISDDLSWNTHIEYIVSKASKRIYFLKQLKRAGVAPHSIIIIYTSIIRPILEYACATWHSSLPKYLCNHLEAVQRRALRIALPSCKYEEALHIANLESLEQRRDIICRKMFLQMSNPSHKLHHLLPNKRPNHKNIRNFKCYLPPKTRTLRFQRSFLPWAIASHSNTNDLN